MSAAISIARYLLSEAASGTAPTSSADDTGNGNILTPNYGGTDANWTSIASGNGFEITATEATSGAIISLQDIVTNGNIGSSLANVTEASAIIKVDISAGHSSIMRIFAVTEGGNNGDFAICIDASERIVIRWNNGSDVVYPAIIGLTTVTVVIDTTQATAADRFKVYYNGSTTPETKVTGTEPAQNTALTSVNGTGRDMCLMNRTAGSRNPVGSCYYAELFTGQLTTTQVSDSHTALLSDNDADWNAVGGSQDIVIGLQNDSETQLALSVTTSVDVSLGLISDNETQLALTPQASNDVSLGLLTDSESLLALSPVTSIDITLGILTDSETLIAFSTGGEINQSIGILNDSESLLGFTPSAAGDVIIGILDDSEALLGITPSTSVDMSLGLLTDSESLLSFTPSQATNVTIGIIDDSESLLGLAVTGSINIQMGLITDSEALIAMVQPSYNPLKYIGVHAILDTTTNYYGVEIL